MVDYNVRVSVEGYQKVYGETVAVSSLSFELQSGQILGMIGPNGAGKTTTLRTLAGVIPPTQGRIVIAGHDIERRPIEAKRALAYIPDDPNLFEALTVWEHLKFIASAYEVDDLDAKGEQLLEQFDLTAKRDTLAQELSRGMRQKVAICCAYLREPQVIFFDEPITGLDPKSIRTLHDSIRERADSGAAIIVSSHQLDLVEKHCTEILIIHRGRKLFEGALEDARKFFESLGGDASLEDVFFHVTEDVVPEEAQ